MLKTLLLLAAMLTLLAGGRRARGALLAQRLGRARLRTVFDRFIAANRTTSTSEANIERFLDDTVDVERLYAGGSIPRLRHELYDQALRLSRLCVALEDGWVGPDRQAAIAAGCREKRAWFEQIASSVDTWFDAANVAESDLQGICNKSMERFNRLIRA